MKLENKVENSEEASLAARWTLKPIQAGISQDLKRNNFKWQPPKHIGLKLLTLN